MAVTLNKANLVLKDANGNIGKIEQLSDRDLAKIKTAVSDVALVVNQSNHTPIEATTTNKGVVQLATYADVSSGAIDKVVTAEQLHNATTGESSALAAKNLARIDAVVTEAGIPIDHTNTNQLKTAITTLVNNAVPSTATSTTLGVVKPDNDTITIDSNGVLTAIKASQDKNGAQIDTTYFKSANGIFTGNEYFRDVDNGQLRFNGGNTNEGGASLKLFGKNAANAQGVFDLVACTKEDASDAKQLVGTPAGVLTWDNKHIVRSVNGVNADDNGNVSITSVNHATSADSATNATKAIQDKNGAQIDTTYFKSANGIFTGNEYFRDVDNGQLRFNGGNTSGGGASLKLFGKNAANAQGIFDLGACTKGDASDTKHLIGTPAGVLTWDNKHIVRSVNGVNADDNGNVSITSVNHATSADSATNATNAYNLMTTSYADHFVKVVLDDDHSYFHIFVVAPDGGFRPVRVVRADSAGSADNLGGYPASKYVRSVNGMNADNNGNVNINFGATVVQSYVNNSGWYRLWSDGWLEQGYIVTSNNSYATVTFLKAFANTNYTIQATPEDIDGNAIPQVSNYVNKTVTSVQVCNLVNTNFVNTPVSVYTCGMGA